MRVMVMFVLLALGCASGEMGGFGTPNPENSRGAVDAGAGGTASGGAPGAAGARGGAGGALGAGGSPAAAGGATGAGGATALGTGGAPAPVTPYCSDIGYPVTSSLTCSKQTSPGVWTYGSKDGHPCSICDNVPAAVECWASSARDLCVSSCMECVF